MQIDPPSEGYVLLRAGLIETHGKVWEIEIQPTPLLQSMFTVMPELPDLYPALVEFVMAFRYLERPRMNLFHGR